ncbi:MAG TPA: thioredoxin [Bacteroidales bacterium]|nr:thioredoxin [Bacteroidales bacterium]
MKTIASYSHFEEILATEAAVLVYFSHDACNVCNVLKPKVAELLQDNFPQIALFFVDTVKTPDIAAQCTIFTVPGIIVYFEGREFFRRSRNIGIDELSALLERPYELMFNE